MCFFYWNAEFGPGKWEGEEYIGQFKDGNREGQGTHTYPSGNKYAGEFKDGNREGQGTYTYVDGSVDNGIWKNNELVEQNNKIVKSKETQPEI